MKEFLKKYLTEEQLAEVETKYLGEHPDAKSLPVYISKARFDEVNGQKKSLEESNAKSSKDLAALQSSIESQIAEAVKKAQEEASAHESDAISKLKLDFNATEAIYKAKGKNVTAIKALIDPTKDINEEITRLQKDESYLFESMKSDLPNGTGKNETGDKGGVDKELEEMRRAVGI